MLFCYFRYVPFRALIPMTAVEERGILTVYKFMYSIMLMMRHSFLILPAFVLLLFVSTVSNVYAVDVSASLSRMDAIIAEMQKLRAEFATLASVSTVPQPASAVLGASTKSFFTQSLALGETNSDIAKVQKLLATDKDIYPYGVTSGFYGPKTQEAIKSLQARFGLKQVGEIGPATKVLLESFFTAYPDDIYPQGVLLKKPMVLGASISTPPAVIQPPVTTVLPAPSQSGLSLSSLTAVYKDGEAKVKVTYANGTSEALSIEANSKLQVIDAVALKLGQKKATILSLIEFTNSITSNDDDTDDSSGDSEYDSITARVSNGEAEIDVEYANGDDDESFTVEETKESQIISEIADELNVDESDIEDIVEFEYEDIDTISADIQEGKAIVTVTFEDGTTKRIKVATEDEDDITKAVAKELGESRSTIEDIIEF